MPVDASTNPANDSELNIFVRTDRVTQDLLQERMLLGKEATENEVTHIGLYETRKRTKYTTEESDVFMKKDIPREINIS